LSDDVVAIVYSFIGDSTARLLHTGDAVERVVGIGSVASVAAVDGIASREDVADGVVVVGHQDGGSACGAGVVDGEQATVEVVSVGIGGTGIVNLGRLSGGIVGGVDGTSVAHPGFVGEAIERIEGEAAGFAVAVCDAGAVACWVVGVGAGCAVGVGFRDEAIVAIVLWALPTLQLDRLHKILISLFHVIFSCLYLISINSFSEKDCNYYIHRKS
jgi:hypothetical protein